MSSFGGGGSADLSKELRAITDELRSFGSGLREAGNAIPGVGFAANTAATSLKSFARDVGFGFSEDVFRFGTTYAGAAADSNMLRAAAGIPTDPFDAGRTQRPIEASFNRLGGITGQIARAGGEVDMETRKRLANLLYDQERRGELDDMQNDWLQGKFAQRKLAGRGGLWGMAGGGDMSQDLTNLGFDLMKKIFGVSVR